VTSIKVPTIWVETKGQSYVLTELHQTHNRLARLLVKIRDNADRSLAYPNLDTLFLTGATDELRGIVATYETLRHAATLLGCSKKTIAAVCIDEWVLIDVPAEVAS
jgi:hypothetical protein